MGGIGSMFPNGSGFLRQRYGPSGRFAFDDLALHRVEVAVQLDNEASRRAVAKAGLRWEGISERYLQVGDEWADYERYAITAEEWTARGDELTDAWLR